MATHYRNFDVLRLVAALSVVFSHSFLIATGSEVTEPLHFTGNVTGVYGVFVFFILSGFLVTESAKRTTSLCQFARKRFLRIAPALVVSTVLVAYVLCPPFDTNGVLAFVSDVSVFNRVVDLVTLHTTSFYFENVVFYPKLHEADYLPGIANGVLWTIRLEVAGYCLIGLMAAAGFFAAQRQYMMMAAVVSAALLAILLLPITSIQWLAEFFFVLPSLCCGILMNWLVQRHRPNGWIALACVAGLVPAVVFGHLPLLFPFLIAYPLIWLGAATFNPLPTFYNGTDISYGVYLYGWPITQLIRHFVGPDLSGYELAALSIPATVIVGWLSWLVVEKPALRFRSVSRAPKPLPV